MPSREDLIAVFEDTEKWYKTDANLKEAIKASIQGTKIYMEGDTFYDTPDILESRYSKAKVLVNKHKTLEAALLIRHKYPEAKVAIHNFASATNPGGGVKKGSRAQEECLCRTTTLYPVLDTDANWKRYYKFHRARHNQIYTDACIYTPGIIAMKTDDDIPRRMAKEDWMKLDVLTCAAPNLRERPSNAMNSAPGKPIRMADVDLLALHEKRARHLFSVAAMNRVDILILGAFGCGAFQNKPEVVAKAYASVLPDFLHQFQVVEFAVYCTPRDTGNYVAFYNTLSKLGR